MGLESGTYLNDLVSSNPVGATDAKSQGDNHLRLIKSVLQASFPAVAGAVWRVQAKSSGYTVLTTDNMTVIRCTAALTLDLTAAASLGNQHLFVIIADGGAVTIDPNGAELVNGAATLVIPQEQAAFVICNGSAFYSLGLNHGLSVGLATVNTFTKRQVWAKGGDLTSADPLVIDTDGNYFDVAGNTNFATMTVAAGTLFMLQFDGTPTLTHGAALDLPGEANFTAAAGDRMICFAQAADDVQVLSIMKADGTAVAVASTNLPQGYQSGCILSNHAGDTAHDINGTAGEWRNAANDGDLKFASEQTKQIDATWASGDAAGGLAATLTVANDTWYHLFEILVSGTVEIGIDTSVVAATLIAQNGATKYRRIGSVKTDGSANVLPFIQVADEFWWKTPPALDVDNATPGTTANTGTLTVPLGVRVKARINMNTSSTGQVLYVSDLAVTDVAASQAATPLGNIGGTSDVWGNTEVWTNTAKQIRYRSSANTGVRIATLGWRDPRGKDD